MDLENVRVFVKVAELGSFTRAAEQLRVSKARASVRLSELEAELGSKLLQRSTRSVRLTPDGEQFLVRARRWLLDADELRAMFEAPSTLRGRVRVDMPVGFARNLFIPRLPELLATHPQLELELSTTDRRVDILREGFDCVLRVGALSDSRLLARRLGVLPMVNCASPSYLLMHGVPRSLADLKRHFVVHYSLRFGAEEPSFEYPSERGYAELAMQSRITVNSSDANLAAALAGLGIVQAPRVGMEADLASGALVEILPELTCKPMLVSIVHGHGRSPPKRVAAVMSWMAQLLEPRLQR